jgi:hypothetical protein
MDAVTKQKILSHLLDEKIVPLIEKRQAMDPASLLTRGALVHDLAQAMQVSRQAVSRQAVSRHINKAVAEGRVLEIRPRSDWYTELPGADDLPSLYAVPEEGSTDAYRLQYARPMSRGAGHVAFLVTSRTLEVMLPLVRRQLGLPEPTTELYYKPGAERTVRPAMYAKLKRKLIETSPENLTSSEAGDILEAVLSVLHLKAPTI